MSLKKGQVWGYRNRPAENTVIIASDRYIAWNWERWEWRALAVGVTGQVQYVCEKVLVESWILLSEDGR